MKKVISCLIVLLLLMSCSNSNHQKVKNYLGFDVPKDSINNFLNKKMRDYHISGLSVAIINNNKIVYQTNNGYEDVKLKTPITNKTIFEGASISKPVFAYFAMKYVDEGKLDLDKPLYEYLPYPDISYDNRYKLITARMVLSHRTGLPNWRENEKDKKLRIKFEPNSKYSYSGEAYQYLAMVLKEISKTDWNGLEQLFQEKVAIPLQMKHTVFIQNNYTRSHKAEPYDENGEWIDWKNNYWFRKEDSIFYAPSSIHTETTDFSKWMIAIMNKKGLSEKGFSELLKPHSKVPEEELKLFYTLGFNKLDYPFTDIYFHGGDNEGFTSLFVLDTTKKWGFILFSNSEYGGDLGKELFFYLLIGPNKAKLYILLGICLLIIIIGIYYLIKKIKKTIK